MSSIDTPFFSIIIPTYNRPQLADRAIESVLKQQYQDFEVLLIDDGSFEDYTELIGKYKFNDRFVYHKQKNAFLAAARNKGISLAKGKWICFLDDDDYYLPNHLSELYNCINYHEEKVGLYRTFTYYENEHFERLPQPINYYIGESSSEYILNVSTITVNNVCLSSEILNTYKFDTELKIAEDYNLWLRVLCAHPLFESAQYTAVYFKSSNSMSEYSFMNAEKYLMSYYKTFSNKQVKRNLSYKVRLAHINKYIIRYFDRAYIEGTKVNMRLLFSVLSSYLSMKLFFIYLKFFLKKYNFRKK